MFGQGLLNTAVERKHRLLNTAGVVDTVGDTLVLFGNLLVFFNYLGGALAYNTFETLFVFEQLAVIDFYKCVNHCRQCQTVEYVRPDGHIPRW